jgi:hypothetical protein
LRGSTASGGRSAADTICFITNGEGQSVDLMSLSDYQMVDTINNLVLTFLNSEGQEK